MSFKSANLKIKGFLVITLIDRLHNFGDLDCF